MCGAVQFTADVPEKFAVCYCKMCQRWASGVFMGVHSKTFEVTEGADHLKVFQSSDWANRAFCDNCGSNIYYHAPAFGSPSVALGTFDDTHGMEARVQFFIDRKPGGFALKNDTKTLTEAECEAHFAAAT